MTTTDTNAKFEQILKLEDAVRLMQTVVAFRPGGLSLHAASQQDVGLAADRQRLYDALAALTAEELVEFGQYRLEARR